MTREQVSQFCDHEWEYPSPRLRRCKVCEMGEYIEHGEPVDPIEQIRAILGDMRRVIPVTPDEEYLMGVIGQLAEVVK